MANLLTTYRAEYSPTIMANSARIRCIWLRNDINGHCLLLV